MYLVLKRFFCLRLANIQQALQLGIVTLQKIVLYRFARKSSFIGQGKNTLSITTVLENLFRYLWYENQQLLPEILGGTNDRRKPTRNSPPLPLPLRGPCTEVIPNAISFVNPFHGRWSKKCARESHEMAQNGLKIVHLMAMIYISMRSTPSLEKVSSYGLLPRFIYHGSW